MNKLSDRIDDGLQKALNHPLTVIVSVSFALYMLVAVCFIDERRSSYYQNTTQEIERTFGERSVAHKEFVQLYVTCNHIITDDINQLCLLVAVTSLNNEENIRLIVREFEALDIKTALLLNSVGKHDSPKLFSY